MTTQFMIRFGELNTKGKNKKDFINTLKRNISHSLSEINNLKIITTHDHIYVDISNIHEEDEAKVVEFLHTNKFIGEKTYKKLLKKVSK